MTQRHDFDMEFYGSGFDCYFECTNCGKRLSNMKEAAELQGRPCRPSNVGFWAFIFAWLAAIAVVCGLAVMQHGIGGK